jgi:hypothetical protein
MATMETILSAGLYFRGLQGELITMGPQDYVYVCLVQGCVWMTEMFWILRSITRIPAKHIFQRSDSP